MIPVKGKKLDRLREERRLAALGMDVEVKEIKQGFSDIIEEKAEIDFSKLRKMDTVTDKSKALSKHGNKNFNLPMNETKLKEKLFDLFSTQSHWRLKDLESVLGETKQRIKSSFLYIHCDYIKSGEYNGQYELKPEFRDTSEATNTTSTTIENI